MVRRMLVVGLGALVAAVAVTACGDDGGVGDAPPAASTSAEVAATSGTSGPLGPSGRAGPTATSVTVVPSGFDLVPLTVTTADGTACELCVWLARTDAERGRGLMGVTDLGGADGMAFVYDAPVTNRYWMRDTPLPLDIAWFDADGALVSTATMTPCLTGPADGCARYGPDEPFVLAVEVVAGRLAELGIGPGSVATLGAAGGCDTP